MAAVTATGWIYARKSHYNSADRRGREIGDSCSDQIRWGEGEAERQGIPVGDRYVDDSKSASRYAHARYREREDFERMIGDIESGRIRPGDQLIMWDQNRQDRDLEVYVRIRNVSQKYGILWNVRGRIYDMRDARDRYYTGMDALRSENEVDNLVEGVRRGLDGSARRGRPHWSKKVYGYTKVFDDRGKLAGVVINPAEAKVLQDAAEQIASGRPLLAVVERLNAAGVPAPMGGQWRTPSMKNHLLNPRYIGRQVHHGEIVETELEDGAAMWPPILDEDLFHRCRAVLTDPSRWNGRPTRLRYLLTGIAVCDVCDGPVTAIAVRKVRSHYGCPARPGPDGPGRHVGRRIAAVDQYVTETLFRRLSRPDAREWLGDDDSAGDQIAKLMTRIGEAQAHLVEAREAYARREISLATMSTAEAADMAEIDAAEAELELLRRPSVAAGLVADTPDEVAARWDELDLVQQRGVLRSLVEVRIKRVGKGKQPPTHESVSLRFTPRR